MSLLIHIISIVFVTVLGKSISARCFQWLLWKTFGNMGRDHCSRGAHSLGAGAGGARNLGTHTSGGGRVKVKVSSPAGHCDIDDDTLSRRAGFIVFYTLQLRGGVVL